MVKNDICLQGASKQNAFFFKKRSLINTLMPLISSIGLAKAASVCNEYDTF